MSNHAQLVELKHSRNHKEPKYIALEDLNFAWLEEEILLVMRMWNEGRAIWDIADALKRPQEEVLILLIDMSMKGGIKERTGGVFGDRAS
jgi:predicted metal-dependent hydrolase